MVDSAATGTYKAKPVKVFHRLLCIEFGSCILCRVGLKS